MKTTKVMVAIGSLGIVVISFANAQNLTTDQIHTATKSLLQTKQFKDVKNQFTSRKAIEQAILSGDYVTFQNVASTSPLKSIDLPTFQSLNKEFSEKKNAEDNIRAILKKAGIESPTSKHTKRLQATEP